MSGDGLHFIEREYGRSFSVQEVADHFRVDPRTVRKYASQLGGVHLFGRIMFFENRIREALDALQGGQARQDKVARPALYPKYFRDNR